MADQPLTDVLTGIKQLLWPDEGVKQRQKRRRILSVANQQFLKSGYRKASIQEIATASGVSKGSIYLYFNSKAELLVQVLAFESEAYFEQLLAVLASQVAPLERLRQFLYLGVQQNDSSPLLAKLRAKDGDMQLALQEVDTGKGVVRDYLQTEILLLEGLVRAVLSPKVSPARRRQVTNIVYDLLAGYMLLPDPLRQTGCEERPAMMDFLLGGLLQPDDLCAGADQGRQSDPNAGQLLNLSKESRCEES